MTRRVAIPIAIDLLVEQGFLLKEDVEHVIARAAGHWD